MVVVVPVVLVVDGWVIVAVEPDVVPVVDDVDG